MRSVQRDGDRHGDTGSQPSTVHCGEAEAVEQAKAFHLTAATRVAVLDRAALDSSQQRQAETQQQCHYALGRNQKKNKKTIFIFLNFSITSLPLRFKSVI